MRQSKIKNFGGGWSGKKLSALKDYLEAYTNALKNQPFDLVYIDAFAGAGIRDIIKDTDPLLFDNFEEEEKYRHGSPLIALANEPPFNEFIFIEQDPDSINSLKEQVQSLSHLSRKSVQFMQGDANEELIKVTQQNWRGRRAVAFLDPFALQVEWKTIEKIAKTQAIDMWLLFPAMAVNRMLPKNGVVPDEWGEKLTHLFGEDGWRDTFYKKSGQMTMFEDFGDEFNKVPKVFDVLDEYVRKRLSSVFTLANKNSLILKNSNGTPLFLLCFASGNPTGAPIAMNIAQHIINKAS